jgi:hypothetical protein
LKCLVHCKQRARERPVREPCPASLDLNLQPAKPVAPVGQARRSDLVGNGNEPIQRSGITNESEHLRGNVNKVAYELEVRLRAFKLRERRARVSVVNGAHRVEQMGCTVGTPVKGLFGLVKACPRMA